MVSGIHVQLAVSDADGCPVASISEEAEIECLTVDRHAARTATEVVGELTVDRDDSVGTELDGVTEVFADDTESVYRYTHDENCPCQRLPEHGCPVRTLRAESGRLLVSFIAPDRETLRRVVTDLRSCCGSVTVNHLTQSGTTESSLLSVDRTAFTDRQYEALETAHEMGYFEAPKRATAEEVATEIGIAVSTFLEHLSVAQTKLLDQVLSA
jgi:predicted DNA binding protein